MDKAERKAMEKHMAEAARRQPLLLHALDALEDALEGLHPASSEAFRKWAAKRAAAALLRAGRVRWIERHRAMTETIEGEVPPIEVVKIGKPAAVVDLEAVRSLRRPRPEVPS